MSGDNSVFAEGSAICIDEENKTFVYGGLLNSTELSDVLPETNICENVEPSRRLHEMKNASSSTVLELPSAPCATVFSTLTAIGNDLFLIFGFTRDEGWSNEVHIFNQNSKRWCRVEIDSESERPGPRDKHCATAVGREVYVFGGFGPMTEEEVEAYEQLSAVEEEEEEEEEKKETTREEQLEETEEKIRDEKEEGEKRLGKDEEEEGVEKDTDSAVVKAKNGHSCRSKTEEEEEADEEGSSSGDKEAGPSVSFSWFNDLWIFDSAEEKGKWRQPLFSTSARPTPRAASSLSFHPKRQWLVSFGGRDYAGRCNDVNIYDIGTRKWLIDVGEGGERPSERSFHASCIHEDRLLVFGGRDVDNKDLNDLFMFDLESLQFQRLTLPQELHISPRSCHAIAVHEDRLFITGGASHFDPELMHCRNRILDSHSVSMTNLLPQETSPATKRRRLNEEEK